MCGALRGGGEGSCKQVLQGAWKFCPRCGSIAGVIADVPEFSASSLPFKESQASVPLKHLGVRNAELDIRVKIVPPDGAIRLATSHLRLKETGLVRLEMAPGEPSQTRTALLEISVDDERRGTDEAGFWTPRRRRTFTVDVINNVARPASIVAEPRVLLMAEGRTTRRFVVRNVGEVSPTITGVKSPIGWSVKEVSNSEGALLTAQAPRTYEIRKTSVAATGGEVQILGEGGALVSLALKIPEEAAFGEVRPRFIVGIDFGTSNTSIYVRDLELGDGTHLVSPAETEMQWPERFPTAILCPTPREETWQYGPEAEKNYAPSAGHLIVYELKTLMRAAGEPYLALSPEYSKANLLAWYLKSLREDIIAPYLRRQSAGMRHDVRYVFSIPVLDGGVQQAAQQSMLNRCAKDAGFDHPGATIEYFEEPVCATLYLLQKQTELRSHAGEGGALDFQDGDQVIVFDSGGGTTDVALSTIRWEDGRIQMEAPLTSGSHIENGQIRQFGGTVVTQELGLGAHRAGQSIHPLALLQSNLGALLPDELTAVFGDAEFDSSEPFEAGAVEDWPPKSWHRRFPLLYRDMERAKITVAAAEEPLASEVVAAMGGLADVTITRKNVDDIFDHHMSPLLGQVDKDLGTPPRLKYVFPVGGNSVAQRFISPHLRRKYRDRLVVLPPKEANLAVARGTVFTYNPTVEALPYDVWIVMRSGVEQSSRIASFTSTGRTSVMGTSTGFELRGSQRLPIEVWCRWEGQDMKLSEFEVRKSGVANERGSVRVLLDPPMGGQPGRLHVRKILSGSEPEEVIFAYEL